MGRSLVPLLAERTRLPKQREVKVEAQVEQRLIRPGGFSPLNLDLSLDLPMRRAQWGTPLAVKDTGYSR